MAEISGSSSLASARLPLPSPAPAPEPCVPDCRPSGRRGNRVAWVVAAFALLSCVSWDAWAPWLLARFGGEAAQGVATRPVSASPR